MDRQTTSSRRPGSAGPRFTWLASSGSALTVSLDFTPGLMIGHLIGHLTGLSSEQLRATFHDARAQRPERVVIDTSELISCDARGVAGLLDSLAHAAIAPAPVGIAGLLPVHRRLVERRPAGDGLDVRTFASLPEAVGGIMSLPGAPAPDQDALLAEVRNLHRALLTRAAIDQAKGILMATYGLDPDAAFSMLVWHSRKSRIPLRELAVRFLAAVQACPPGSLTTIRADALLADIESQPPT